MDLKEAFHSINLRRKTYFDDLIDLTDLNLMELEILVSLADYPEQNTFTDIMRSKDYAKSYVSKAITHLVELGYIAKEGIDHNKKVQKLFLLEQSTPIVDSFKSCVDTFRKDAFIGISQQEYEVFEHVLEKISLNLSGK
ncbi:MAG: MarR family transcriptional regulator [Lachnospiraceae bacterium]